MVVSGRVVANAKFEENNTVNEQAVSTIRSNFVLFCIQYNHHHFLLSTNSFKTNELSGLELKKST
jgi:hypothetical protein